MICHLSNARKYCQIRLILPELCDPKVGRMRRNFFLNLIYVCYLIHNLELDYTLHSDIQYA